MDPNGREQGPFKRSQMDAWYQGLYFQPDLRVRRSTESTFTALGSLRERSALLGDLQRQNGHETPFAYADEELAQKQWEQAAAAREAAIKQLESIQALPTPPASLASMNHGAGYGPG